MAFDSLRGVTVLFGGYRASGYLNDTWEYDGSGWTQGPAAPAALTPRWKPAMAYDSVRSLMVLFGGMDQGSKAQDDTWEYDGAAWTRRADGLEPRFWGAMAYDSARGRCVLHGGSEVYRPLTDTVEYDGTAWSHVSSFAAPSSRHDHAMAYDSLRGRTVLFGGQDPVGYHDDTWEYNGTTWSAGPPAPAGLTPRHQHTMSFDATRGRTVLFGGEDATGRLNDTWEYDGSSWVPGAMAPGGLTARSGHAQCFQTGLQRTVVFGGTDGAALLGDTWTYDGLVWTVGPTGPSARQAHGMAYDMLRGRVVLFGGLGTAGTELDDTWELAGGGWIQAPNPNGLALAHHAMTYDGQERRIIAFGGSCCGGILTTGPYAYDGIAWTTVPVMGQGVESRTRHAMAFDAQRSRVVMFGGYYTYASVQYEVGETLEFDGSSLQERPPRAIGLTARKGSAAVFDASRNRVVFFGGQDDYTRRADTWEWDGTSQGWTLGPPAPTLLTERAQHAMVYDLSQSRTILFGGRDATGLQNDTWVYDGVTWAPGSSAPAGLTPREEHAMSYDLTRSRTILFGGSDGALRNDTWEYVAGSWVAGAAAPGALSGRRGHAMAFDMSRGKTILFGGDDGSLRNDTWELDGAGWSAGPPSPPALTPRRGQTLAFDATRGLAILFGGDAGLFVRDTWEYNGSVWVRGSQEPVGLRGRAEHSMAYDQSRGKVVLLGGDDGQPRGDVWEYNCPTIVITPATLPVGQVGYAYSATLTATGGWAPHTFALTAGSLPAGLTLAPSGLISGTPSAGGSFSFTVAATDSTGCAGSASYTLAIGCPSVTVTPFTLPVGAVGNPYSVTIVAVGGVSPYSYAVSSGSLPSGLTLDSAGLLSGVPTATGSWSFTITATDAASCTGTRTYTLIVSCGSLVLVPTSLPPAAVGVPYSTTIAATGGAPPYSFSVTGGALPPGIGLSVSGVLSGTPTAPGAYSFTITATDSQSCVGSWGYALPVTCPTIVLSPPTLPSGALGIPYSQIITASGGVPPHAFGLLSGSLPPGLSLSTGGVLYGTPSTPGTYSFTIVAVDTSGCSGSIGYNMVIFNCGTIALSPATLPNATLAVPYSATITASGGISPYTYTVTSGNPPLGISLSLSGILSGTPTATGTFNFTVTATDANACTGSHAYQIVVSCAGITLSPPSLPAASVGIPYSVTITASGGQAPYAFTLGSGSLPPGVGLATGGTISGTPAAAGSFAFTVVATDALGCSGSQGYVLDVGAVVDYLVGQGLGQPNANRVRIYTAAGSATTVDFLAYSAGKWGVNVASGNVDGGAQGEIVTGPGPGDVLGPQVRAFDRYGAPKAKVNFFAYGTLKFGVNPASASWDADAYDELGTGAGPGAVFGPHVRGFNFDGATVTAIAKISYFAYATLKYGVNATGGDIDGDGFAEIVTGAGPSAAFGPQVRAFNVDGGLATSIAKVNFNAFAGVQYGVNIASGDVDADAYAEILSAKGPGPSFTSDFVGHDFDATVVSPLAGFTATPFATHYGGRVGEGDVSGDGAEDLLTGAGRDPAADSNVKAYRYDGTALTILSGSFVPFGTATHGVNVAGARLGY